MVHETRREVHEVRREGDGEQLQERAEESSGTAELSKQEQYERGLPVCAIVQDCEVYVDQEGKTVTYRCPLDEDVRLMAAGQRPPVFVRRPMYFRCEIPGEYQCLRKYTKREGPGARFTLTMPFAEWEERARREEENGGHLVE